MKKIILGLLVLTVFEGFSQAITVNTTISEATLVNTVFSGTATNISRSTGNGLGTFQNTNPAFPLSSGIVICGGNSNSISGTSTMSTTGSGITDSDLQAFSNATGSTGFIQDASFLSFNFVATTSSVSMDYVFASEEYGTYQCGFSDKVAFLLTNLATGVTTNIAVVPQTTTPVSVNTIRNNVYNSGCPSVNPQYFSTFNSSNNSSLSGTCFNGRTVLLNASSNLVVGNTYKLKIVIGDFQDSLYDSAIFMKSSLLDTNILGPDLTVANNTAVCQGNLTTLSTGLSPSNYSFQWNLNGVINPGETGSFLEATLPGFYEVVYTNLTTTLVSSDSIIVEYNVAPVLPMFSNVTTCDSYTLPFLTIGDYYTAPNGLGLQIPAGAIISSSQLIYVYATNGNCSSETSFMVTINQTPNISQPQDLLINEENTDGFATFNLASQIPIILNGQSPNDFQVNFYVSLNDALNNANPITIPSSYTNSSNPQVIYVNVSSNLNVINCYTTTSFTLQVQNIVSIIAFQDFVIYEPTTDGVATFDLTSQIPAIIGVNSNPNDYEVLFFTSYEDALANVNSIANPTAFVNTSNPQTIYVRVTSLGGRSVNSVVIGTMNVAVEETLSNFEFDYNKIQILPNPVVDFVTISAVEIIKNIKVYSIVGQEIINQSSVSNQIKLDLSKLISATYFVKIETDKNQKVYKIIKK